MSLKGHLGTIALPELLQWLAIGQKTGTLVISENSDVHRVVVDRGRIVSTATTRESLQLGRALRAAGLVDEETVARALKLRQATGMSIGRVLLTLQAVDEEDLRRALRDKAEALISTLFHSSSASFQFVEDSDLGDPGVQLSLDATQLVLSAAHNLERPAAGDSSAAGGDRPASDAPGREASSPPRPTVGQPTATVIETLPEDAEPIFQTQAKRRRAWGGLAAAAALAAAVGAVLIIARSQVPAKAEEAAESAATVASGVASRAAGGASAVSLAERFARPGSEGQPVAGLSPAEDPAPPAAPDSPPPIDDRPMEELFAEREAELREQYREEREQYRVEVDELRRRLEAAQTATAGDPPAVGNEERESSPSVLASAPASAPPETAAADATEVAVAEPSGGPRADVDPATSVAARVDAVLDAPDAATGAPAPPAQDEKPAALDGSGSLAGEADGVASPAAAPASATTPARLLSRPMPAYPPAARRLRREAQVTLKALVGADGRVSEIRTVGAEVGLGFDEAARASARLSRWRPATRDGAPTASWVDLRFDFKLP